MLTATTTVQSLIGDLQQPLHADHIHVSGSLELAQYEMSIWFEDFELEGMGIRHSRSVALATAAGTMPPDPSPHNLSSAASVDKPSTAAEIAPADRHTAQPLPLLPLGKPCVVHEPARRVAVAENISNDSITLFPQAVQDWDTHQVGRHESAMVSAIELDIVAADKCTAAVM